MGRNVETDFLAYIEKELVKDGLREIIGEYIPTLKNSIVSTFWEDTGYITNQIKNNVISFIHKV